MKTAECGVSFDLKSLRSKLFYQLQFLTSLRNCVKSQIEN